MVLLRAGPESLGPAILKRLQRRDTLETIALEGGGLACNYQEECGAMRPYSPSRREKEEENEVEGEKLRLCRQSLAN